MISDTKPSILSTVLRVMDVSSCRVANVRTRFVLLEVLLYQSNHAEREGVRREWRVNQVY